MFQSEFSERLFEFFYNHEFLNTYDVHIYVPSQNREGLSGYDAKLKGRKTKAILLQFKIVNQYERAPHLYTSPAFKFELLKHKVKGYRQHNQLFKIGKKGLLALYVVPPFVDYKTLYTKSYKSKLLLDCNYYYPTHKIVDNKYHYVTFDSSNADLHSKESRSLRSLTGEDFLGVLTNSQFEDWQITISKLNDLSLEYYNQIIDDYSNLEYKSQENFSLDKQSKIRINNYMAENHLVLLSFIE